MPPEKTLASRLRAAARRLTLVGIGLGLGLVVTVAEGVARSGRIPTPRQVVLPNNVRSVHGVTIWEPSTEREHVECALQNPGRTRIVFYGNSITYGLGLPSETFSVLLEERLNAARPDPGFCVMNFAVPGFRFGQKFAMAQDTMPRFRPALAFYQDWDMEWGGVGCPAGDVYPLEYVQLGNEVFGTMGLRVRPDGLPGMASVPDRLNHFLFSHSALYRDITLDQGEPIPPPPPCGPEGESAFRVRSLRRFTAFARSLGANPMIFIAADLTYPLNETHPQETALEQPLVDMGAADGVPVIKLRDLLHDQDNTAIRMDAFHYNVAGNRIMAERFERVVLDALGPAPTAGTP